MHNPPHTLKLKRAILSLTEAEREPGVVIILRGYVGNAPPIAANDHRSNEARQREFTIEGGGWQMEQSLRYPRQRPASTHSCPLSYHLSVLRLTTATAARDQHVTMRVETLGRAELSVRYPASAVLPDQARGR